MTLEEKYEALRRAIFEMGKFMRQNPPAVLDGYYDDMELLAVLAGGSQRDPNGEEYCFYFVNKAIKEIEKENGKRI